MKMILKLFYLFVFGGIVYALIELLFRGNTHWTMVLAGGLCFILIGGINEIFTYEMAITSQMLISAVIITVVEFFTGLLVNCCLGWNVWDYSDMPYNLHGQVCLIFLCAWFFLSLAAILLDDFLRYKLFGEEKPHYKIL